TNHEHKPTRLDVADREDVELRCHYCVHSFKGTDIEIIK
ncbi:MAG: aspartate carbamoyltransferase regulatory subunit, partial [Muribaculaceae bacterium]|nr:aspartate carbamoyltransferase regulatory subunit [Muribaculaceae bacterium]